MRRDDEGGMLRLPVSPERDHLRGDPELGVVLVEYGDFECSFCARAYTIVEEILRQIGDDVCFVFRHFPLTMAHPRAMSAAQASECAAAQDAFWPMHHALFEHQDALEDEDLVRYATDLNLDVARFQDELASGSYERRVREDFLSGVRSGVNGTPTFFIDGRRHEGAWDLEALSDALLAAIARKKRAA